MGWNGEPMSYCPSAAERKRKLDHEYNYDTQDARCTVLKSQMVGSTYYAAIKFENKKENTSRITAAIVFTAYEDKEFMTKHFGEDAGPCKYDCPSSILNILDPPKTDIAKEWREQCKNKKTKHTNKNPYLLQNLPEGSIIKTTFGSTWGNIANKTLTLQKTIIATSFMKKGQLKWKIIGMNSCISRNSVSSITKYQILRIGDKDVAQPIEIDTENLTEPKKNSILFFNTLINYNNEKEEETISSNTNPNSINKIEFINNIFKTWKNKNYTDMTEEELNTMNKIIEAYNTNNIYIDLNREEKDYILHILNSYIDDNCDMLTKEEENILGDELVYYAKLL